MIYMILKMIQQKKKDKNMKVIKIILKIKRKNFVIKFAKKKAE